MNLVGNYSYQFMGGIPGYAPGVPIQMSASGGAVPAFQTSLTAPQPFVGLVPETRRPALAVLLYERSPGRRPGAALGARIRQAYAATVRRTVHTPARALLALGALGLAGLVMVPFLEEPDRPSFRDRDILVRWEGTPSTSLPEMDRITRRAAAELRVIPGIRSVDADVGRAVSSDRLVATNSSEIWVRIAPSADYDRALRRVRQEIAP